MNRLLLAGVVPVLAALGMPVQAYGWGHCCAPACTPVAVSYVEKTVVCYQPQWEEKEVQYTVHKCVAKEVVQEHKATVMVPEFKDEVRTVTVCRWVPKEVVQDHKVTVMVPEYKDEDRTITVHTMKAVQVPRQVTTCKMVAVTMTDCCGCSYQVCKPVLETHTVMTTQHQCVPEERQVKVKVCHYRPEEKTFQTKHIVCERVEEQKQIKVRVCHYRPEERTFQTKHLVYESVPEVRTAKVRVCKMVAVQQTVKVPVCTPVCGH